MSGSHRAHADNRPRKSGNGLLVAAGGLACLLFMGLVIVVIIALRPGETGPSQAGAAAVKSDLRPPRSGPPVKVTTPEGYGYSLAAVGRGTVARQAAPGATEGTGGSDGNGGNGGSGAATGATGAEFAYADYVLTNTTSQPVLLDFPADLFVRRSKLSAEALGRCTPKPGNTADMCTLPGQSKIIGYLNGSKPPTVEQSGERYMPAGASYLVRTTTNLPVKADAGREDLGLFIWNVRYSPQRQAIEVAFP